MIVQIGFNKCATTALFRLFAASGYGALHSNGRYWRKRGHPALGEVPVQVEIAERIEAGRPPFEGLEDFDAFLDMEFSTATTRVANYRRFDAIAEAYPHARFILNIRDKADWLRSRARHHDGRYLADAAEYHGETPDAVIRRWSDAFDAHNKVVRAYFADTPSRLCVFDTDTDPIAKIAAFVAPHRAVDVRKWATARVTDVKAAEHGWTDTNGDIDIDAILGEDANSGEDAAA